MRTDRAAGFAAAVLLAAGAASSTGIPWRAAIEPALVEARAANLPVLVEVYADWCLPCKIMEREVWSRAEVVTAARGFVPLRVDADVEEGFVTRHAAAVLPTTLLLDDSGAEIARIAGLAGAPQVAAFLDRARGGWETYSRDVLLDGDAEALERSATYLMSLGNSRGAAERLERALAVSRAGHASVETIERLELRVAQARLAGDRWADAEPDLERLARGAARPDTRGWALAGLADVRQRQDRPAEAAELLRKLAAEHPDISRALGAAR